MNRISRMTLGSATLACLSLAWLAAACAPIHCLNERAPDANGGCACPPGYTDDGVTCHLIAPPTSESDGRDGSFDPTGQRSDASAPLPPRSDDGGSTPPSDPAPGPREDGGARREPDAGAPPTDNRGERDDGEMPAPPAPPPDRGPPPSGEPACADRCPSRQCDGDGRCLECASDRDCQPAAPHCGAGNRCVACTADAHCGGGRCVDQACVSAPAVCPDGQVSGSEQCEAGIGWYTEDHCLPSCKFRFWSLCEADGSCPAGLRCHRGMCAPEACEGGRGACRYFNNLVVGQTTYCPALPDHPPMLLQGLCLPRCNQGACPPTLTCINNSFCAAH